MSIARSSDSNRRALLAGGLFLAVFLSVALTARGPGLTWDESIYYGSAARYTQWFESAGTGMFEKKALLEAWWTADHPPLGSLWIAASFQLFPFFDIITSARLGAGLLFAAAALTIFLWVSRRRGQGEALLAAGLFALMPRIFAHGHFANLEMMTLLLWTLTIVAFEKGIESHLWSVLTGLFFGLSLLAKINGVFLPVLLVPWGLIFHGHKSLRNMLMMALIGPAVFFAGWPTLWVAPVEQLKAYIGNKGAQRMIIPVEYLGTVYRNRFAPWHYPFVMMLVTTPLVVLIGAARGVWEHCARIARCLRGAKAPEAEKVSGTLAVKVSDTFSGANSGGVAHEALVLWAFLFPVLLLALPGVPKYDGIRLMLPAYPFLATLAARGWALMWERMRVWSGFASGGDEGPTLRRLVQAFARFPHRAAITVAVVGAVAAGILAPVILFHPYQLSYYNALAGGPCGARRLGFETTFWNDTFDDKALAYLNDNVRQGGKVAFVALGDFVWQIYQANGDAREDIRRGEFADGDWDYLVVIPRQGWWSDAEREFVRTHEPVWVNRIGPRGKLAGCMIYKAERSR